MSNFSFYFDQRRTLRNGKYPLKIRITFTQFTSYKKVWKQYYFPTGISLSVQEYKKIFSSKPGSSARELQIQLRKIEARATTILNDNPFISAAAFKSLFLGGYTTSASLAHLFEEKIQTLKKNNQLASADIYQCAMRSLSTTNDLSLLNIDATWLKEYERQALIKGKSITTIGLYLRCLRSVFNTAIQRKIIPVQLYPFKQYTIPQSNNFKKALNATERKIFLAHKPIDKASATALGFWKFSYYCNGINFKDMAYLTSANISNGLLIYKRRKTAGTERNQTPLVVPLRAEALQVLAQHGKNEPYLFGIIEQRHTPAQQREHIKKWIKTNNQLTKAIAATLGISIPVTTYTARHTVATTLLEAGADLRDIKETLGHSSFTTTERYIATLDISRKRKLIEML